MRFIFDAVSATLLLLLQSNIFAGLLNYRLAFETLSHSNPFSYPDFDAAFNPAISFPLSSSRTTSTPQISAPARKPQSRNMKTICKHITNVSIHSHLDMLIISQLYKNPGFKACSASTVHDVARTQISPLGILFLKNAIFVLLRARHFFMF
jgi:hypothetical protein